MDASYKCTNFGNCSSADRQEIITSASSTDPKCPECDGTLTPMQVGSSIFNRKAAYVLASILLLTTAFIFLYRVANPPIEDVPDRIPTPNPENDKRQQPDNNPQNSPPVDTAPDLKKPLQSETSKEAIEMRERGILYLQIAKQSKGKDKTEALKNAAATLDKAIKAEAENERCFASAVMNRGMVNYLLNKPNKAIDDLKEALRCDPKHALTNMNLAMVYTSQKKIDLALDQIDMAIKNGFTDCKTFRDDSDLKGLKNNPEYREILERNKLFCLK